jgi:hypothetical protein
MCAVAAVQELAKAESKQQKMQETLQVCIGLGSASDLSVHWTRVC